MASSETTAGAADPSVQQQAAAGGSSDSFRLLSYVQTLRLRNDEATKEFEELDNANQSMHDSIKKEKKSQRKLEREVCRGRDEAGISI